MSESHPSSQPFKRSPAERAADRREDILRAAIEDFARLGYAGADVAQIAERAGCAKGTVYLYYKSKEDLFAAAVEFAMGGLIEATCRAEEADPVAGLERAIREYLAYFDANPAFADLLIQERAVFRDRRRPTYFEYREANRERWREKFRGLIESGRMRRIPPDRAIDVIGDLLYGAMFTNHFAGRRKPLGEQAADLVDVLFHGLLTREAPGEGSDGASGSQGVENQRG